VEAADNAELASVLAHEIGHTVGIGGADAETAIARGVATAAGLDRNTRFRLVWTWHYSVPTVGRMNLKQIEGDPDFRTRWLCPIRHDFMEKLPAPARFPRFEHHPATSALPPSSVRLTPKGRIRVKGWTMLPIRSDRSLQTRGLDLPGDKGHETPLE